MPSPTLQIELDKAAGADVVIWHRPRDPQHYRVVKGGWFLAKFYTREAAELFVETEIFPDRTLNWKHYK